MVLRLGAVCMSIGTRATLDDLLRFNGKAELIGARIVPQMPNERKPGRVADRIARSLDDDALANDLGEAYGDGVGFAVAELSSGRESFSPDASFFTGPFSTKPMRFADGAPTLAVEVRSGNDYAPAAEVEIHAKRADYFEAGTLVVWDVDPEAETITVYRSNRPESGVSYARGDVADAEPAVPRWRIPVDAIFHRVVRT